MKQKSSLGSPKYKSNHFTANTDNYSLQNTYASDINNILYLLSVLGLFLGCLFTEEQKKKRVGQKKPTKFKMTRWGAMRGPM